MLSDRLKGKPLFKVTVEELKGGRVKEEALDLLEECVDHLILAMATIENLGILSREDIEDYVISYMEAFEQRYYSFEEDQFDKFIKDYLRRG